VGTHLLKRLAKMRDAFPNIVGDVRGKGLMIGVEMVSDAETRTPMQAPHFLEIWEECKDRGVLIGRGGLHGNVSIIFLLKIEVTWQKKKKPERRCRTGFFSFFKTTVIKPKFLLIEISDCR
jgi:4-aminobutyrate aminotransferase-like enzyme